MSEAYDNERSPSGERAGSVARMKAERPAAKKRGQATKKRAPKKTKGKTATVVVERERNPWRDVLLGTALLGICLALGVQSASQSQRMRTLYSQLQQDALAKDALLAQQSRLLIERGALQSFHSVDRLAEDKLKMRFPESITRITREKGE